MGLCFHTLPHETHPRLSSLIVEVIVAVFQISGGAERSGAGELFES